MSNFIKSAIKRPGALTRKAKARGESVGEMIAHPPKDASTRTKREINFAKELRRFHHGGKKLKGGIKLKKKG